MCLGSIFELFLLVMQSTVTLIPRKRLYRCTMWKAHQWIFTGTVEQLCLVTFLSEITELQKSANLCDLKKSAAQQSQECVPARKASVR